MVKDQLPVNLKPRCTHRNIDPLAQWHTHRAHDSFEVSHKRPKCGWWLNSWKFSPLLQNRWNNPPTHELLKLPSPCKLNTPSLGATLTCWDGQHSVCGMCISLNKPALILLWLTLKFSPSGSQGSSVGGPSHEPAWDLGHGHPLTPCSSGSNSRVHPRLRTSGLNAIPAVQNMLLDHHHHHHMGAG